MQPDWHFTCDLPSMCGSGPWLPWLYSLMRHPPSSSFKKTESYLKTWNIPEKSMLVFNYDLYQKSVKKQQQKRFYEEFSLSLYEPKSSSCQCPNLTFFSSSIFSFLSRSAFLFLSATGGVSLVRPVLFLLYTAKDLTETKEKKKQLHKQHKSIRHP